MSNTAKNKNQQAFNKLMETYSAAVYYLIKRIVGVIATEEDLEEMTSDVFVGVWLNIGAFNEERGSLQTFIYMKAKYRALTFKRLYDKQQKRQDLNEMDIHQIKDQISVE